MPSFALGLLWLLASACTQFPVIPDTGCGNGVIEKPTEDCDTFDGVPGSKCREKGTVNECHFDCSPGPDGKPRPCEAGWGCDADSICREPSGKFLESSLAMDVGAWTLSAGDFDGDGRQDVMSSEPLDATGATRLRFNYFDQRGALAETQLFPKSVLSPTVNQISVDDRISDVAFTAGPLAVMNGNRERSWVPQVFSSYRRPDGNVRVVGVYDREIDGTAPFAIFITFPTGSGFYLGDRETGKLDINVSVPGSIADLAGDLVSGNVFEDSKHSPCLEPVFAMRDATYFSIVDVCDTDETGAVLWRPKFEVTKIALVPPNRIDVAPQVFDMDGDGHQDVLVGAAGRPYVAFGDGSTLSVATPYVLHADDPAFPRTTPLAVADFTGDGAPDFVFPDRLVVSSTAHTGALPIYQDIGNRLTSLWTVAKIADFNGNHQLDVVAASSGSLNLDFYNGTGTEYLSASRVSTSAPVQLLSAGDFDGDLITDLALVEVPLPAAQEASTLKVAFGSAFAPLGSPLAVGQIDQLEALSSYRSAGRDNLTVCSSEIIQGKQYGALTLLVGGPDRVPFAPLTLTEFSSNESVRDANAFAVVPGRFVSKAQSDLLALGFFRPDGDSPPPIDVWSVPAITTPGRAPTRLSDSLDPRLTPVRFTLDGEYSADVAGTSADLDDDEENEQDQGKERDEAIFVMPADEGSHCGLLFLAVEAGGSFGSAAREPLIIDEPCADPEILAVKLQGKGPPDLALLIGPSEDRHLYVLWNDGHGQFSAQNRTQVSAPGDSPRAFTVLPLANGKYGFVYLTKDSVWLVRSLGPHEFAEREPIPGDVNLRNGTGIVAADVNGDRLSDLVLSASGSLLVFNAQLTVP